MKEQGGFHSATSLGKKSAILRPQPCTCSVQMGLTKEEMKTGFSHYRDGERVQAAGCLRGNIPGYRPFLPRIPNPGTPELVPQHQDAAMPRLTCSPTVCLSSRMNRRQGKVQPAPGHRQGSQKPGLHAQLAQRQEMLSSWSTMSRKAENGFIKVSFV